MMAPFRHLMIDIETVDTLTTAGIVSIGAVMFEAGGGSYQVCQETFYREVDWMDQLKKGRTQSDDTMAFWGRQPPEVQMALYGIERLGGVLGEFAIWVKKMQPCNVWSKGPHFDMVILEHAMKERGVAIPWKFWQVRDCRTWFDISKKCVDMYTHSRPHNALDDAIYQAQVVVTISEELSKCTNLQVGDE